MNKVILMGRLTKDTELRYTANQIATCSFSIAVDRRFKSQDGSTQADFINCVAWRQTAEFINKYFSKGSKILVTGSIQTRTYDGKDGQRHYVTEVVVDDAEFCERKNGNSSFGDSDGAQGNAAATSDSANGNGYYPIEDDENVPF